MIKIYFDVMLKGMFLFQVAYNYCPAFKLDMGEVMQKVYDRRPSLKDKDVQIYFTENVVR